jgi:nitroreductase
MSDARTAWRIRYGGNGAPPEALHLNAVLEQLLAHRSVRAYLPKALPEGTLETLIAAAQSASTSSNLQVWSVVAVQDSARKERLSMLAGNQAHIRNAPLFLVWLADLARLDRQCVRAGQHAEGMDFLEGLLLGVIDAALAAQNTVVAMESLGLANVCIGAMRNKTELVAAELGLPPLVFPVFGMCVGYADPDRPAAVKPRLPQQTVLHRERYSPDLQDTGVQDYDQIMEGFYAGQGMPPARWSQQCIRRLATPASLNGREHMVAALHRLGFGLR